MGAPYTATLSSNPKPNETRADLHNVLEVTEIGRAVLLLMRRKERVTSGQAANRVRWAVSCEVALEGATIWPGGRDDALILLPPSPGRASDEEQPRSLTIGPLSSQWAAVALALYPVPCKAFRFYFAPATPDAPDHPDGFAFASAILLEAPQHLRIGFFRLPVELAGLELEGLELGRGAR